MEPPNNPLSFPHVIVGSYGGGPFFGSFRGSGLGACFKGHPKLLWLHLAAYSAGLHFLRLLQEPFRCSGQGLQDHTPEVVPLGFELW